MPDIKKHTNNIGFHFYLPFKPHQLFTIDLWLGRISVFIPFYLSLSLGILGKVGLQIGGGIKYDPTETAKLGEIDYLFSVHFRIHKLGENCRVNSEASF
mgnify:CR=1 FL=1